MIGGTDLILPSCDAPSCWDVVFRALARHWPDYVHHDAASAEAPQPRATRWIPRFEGRELLAYRDMAAYRSWHDEGATDQNAGDMLYFIQSDGDASGDRVPSLTIVHGGDGRSQSVLEEIASGLRDRCLAAGTSRRKEAA